jgi:RNA polymerase sigma-70 factor, ECF subfamily
MIAVAAIEHDAQLMMKVREGDNASFAVLLDRHRTPVFHFIYRMVPNQSVAEDLAQEVFLRVYRSRATYEPTAKFTTWLFRIASHVTLNWIRDRKNEKAQESLDEVTEDGTPRQVADQQWTAEQRMIHEARLRDVRRAIESLPEKQRAAVIMHKYEEMDYSQISRSLECTESAVKSLLFRAYETLRVRLAQFG